MKHSTFSSTDGRRRKFRHCLGSVIIEVVLAAALLATAGVALAKLSRGAATLSRQADHHLAASLAGDNVLHRLRAFDISQIRERTGAIEGAVSLSSGCDVKIHVEDFQSGSFRGIHVRVDATTQMNVNVRRHDWRIDVPADDSEIADESDLKENPTPEDSQ